MLKKYIPYFIFIGAVLLYMWVKNSQRGEPNPVQTYDFKTPVLEEPFLRDTSKIIYTKHSICRMDCRKIDEDEVKEIIIEGKINYAKIEEDNKGKTYPLEGVTSDKQLVRVVVAPKKDELIIVTVIDLDTDWDCNCN